MSDRIVRQNANDVPVPHFDTTPFTVPPALGEATVAVVTTAGLKRPQDPGWGQWDQSFRTLDRDERTLTLGHLSPNFDRSGLIADLNVVYPVERLQELAEEGIIGAVAPRHLSFMGAQNETMETLRQDTGRAAAKQLLADGVQVVVLTPV